ncbi:MAG TPA: tail fiber protein [Flavobacteriales bacterium]|nr:phage tail protein [Flavobacteriales bacterium]HRE75873.1 tail fiber protein [Flavobacteriales bacterium]HRE97353.1 tail fiber protein [Flavobacteriales bacterium]HRJ34395.1 tail fiber protein [Flavobacteriales bacterium]HRJ40059.1 tail fiber protein [Flavobacteriales bacterium]
MEGLPIGTVQLFAFSFELRDWKICDGSLLTIPENRTLFTLIGNRYGGDGIHNFALPDLRKMVPIEGMTYQILVSAYFPAMA